MIKPIGVILAGGQARRMGGGDKGRLQLGSKSLLDHVCNRLEAQVAGLALNTNGNPDRFSDLGLPVVADSIGGFVGPLAGVLAGLDWAHGQDKTLIVTVAADTPFFPLDLVTRLLTAGDGMADPLVLAATRDGDGKTWRHPTFGLWPVSLRHDLRGHLEAGLRKVIQWSDKHQGRQIVFETVPFDPFFNINKPEDLKCAEQMLKEVE
jgi:molybdopterin-guanine dinucleotide biosynthesis protein A